MIRIHPLAESEIEEAAQYYEDLLEGLGTDFLRQVLRCGNRVVRSPESGAPRYRKFRRLPLRRFPFFIVYEVLPESLLVVAVAHQRRKPGYWRKRSHSRRS